jgi:uncharacterized membrane protein SpoIIM required for sporulation
MTEQYFLQLREHSWNDFQTMLSGGAKVFKKNAAEFPDLLRALSADLNTARANGFDPAIEERLNRLVTEGNHILYRQRSFPLKEFAVFIGRTFPCAVRKRWRPVAACHLIFYGLLLFFYLICLNYDDITTLIVPPPEKRQMLDMYDPSNSYFLKPRKVENDADMFGFYIYNNVSIAFRTFAGGIFAGLGSLFFLMLNAISLGAVAAIIVDAGFYETFFSFTAGHSAFELTGIVLSATAGLILGYNFFFPQGRSRGAALREAGKTAGPIISGSAVLIMAAAVIEAFWSSRHEIDALYHYISGAVCWSLLIAYFLCVGKKRPTRLKPATRKMEKIS